jgi:hypothetical protein
MYLTAHRVAGADGQRAIHAYLYRHDSPDCPYPEDDPWRTAVDAPGRLDRMSAVLPAGGNRVISYLDVMGPDDAWRWNWNVPVRLLAASLTESGALARFQVGPLRVQFYNSPESGPPGDEYERLFEAILRLVPEEHDGR